MNKISRLLLVFFLILAIKSNAQQDTTGGGGMSDLPVVTDTPKAMSEANQQFIADSLKRAKAKTDSLKMGVDEKEFIKNRIKELCTKGMYGRGYVKDGWDSAAKYILKKFKEYKLQPVTEKGPYAQGFAFPVNTFPGKMELFVNGDSLYPGYVFLIDPASPSFVTDSGAKLKVKKLNFKKVSDTASLAKKIAGIDSTHAYYIQNIDRACENMDMRKDQLLAMLPKGCFIVPEEKKLTWATRREPIAATIFYVKEDSLPKRLKNVRVNANAVYNPHQRSENIIACVPGAVKDTYVVFTAHYDGLGMMGAKTAFQGGSDNASGVAMLLYLASYFSKHPQHYTILFIAFGAEEASLMGSEFFVFHPMVPLKNIKFLTNIKIMGDATNGITVVNATNNIAQFTTMEKINAKEKYLKTLYPRENAANSDHYYFSKRNVPCFYIYSNGGNNNYHSVYDVKTDLSLSHVDGVARLLIDYVIELKDIVPIAPTPKDTLATPADNSTPPPGENTTTPAMPTAPPAEGTEPAKPDEPTQAPEEKPGEKPEK